MYQKPFNSLEVETRFLILDEGLFSTLESRITRTLDASKGISLRPAIDWYFDPTEDFSVSKRNKEFHRLRKHKVYENDIRKAIKQTVQTKKMVEPAKNRYGIEPWLETSNHVISNVNKEKNDLKKQGHHFLKVYGYRNAYSTKFDGLSLEINFDRMLSPKGGYVEVGTETEGFTLPDLENTVKSYTGIIADFIDIKLKKLLDGLNVGIKVEPIYPLILLK